MAVSRPDCLVNRAEFTAVLKIELKTVKITLQTCLKNGSTILECLHTVFCKPVILTCFGIPVTLPGSISGSCCSIWRMLQVLSFLEDGVLWSRFSGLTYGLFLAAGLFKLLLCFKTWLVFLVFFDNWSVCLLVCSALEHFSVDSSPESVGFYCPISDSN